MPVLLLYDFFRPYHLVTGALTDSGCLYDVFPHSVDLCYVAFNRRKVSPRWRRNDMPVSVSATSGAKRRAEVRGREEEGPGAPQKIFWSRTVPEGMAGVRNCSCLGQRV